MTALLANAESRPRLMTGLAAASSSVAVLVAAIGLYGTISFLVVSRRREIAVRRALGARSPAIVRLVLGPGIVVTLSGLIAGGLGGAVVTPTLQSVLFRVTPFDGPTFVGAACVLLGVAILAAIGPTRRALRVDPLVVMKDS